MILRLVLVPILLLAACSPTPASGPAAETSSPQAAGRAAPATTVTAACGGIAGLQCEASQWCDYPADAACGAADQQGTCRARPEACAKIHDPVCGCDGRSYGNACEANAAGTAVLRRGECS